MNSDLKCWLKFEIFSLLNILVWLWKKYLRVTGVPIA